MRFPVHGFLFMKDNINNAAVVAGIADPGPDQTSDVSKDVVGQAHRLPGDEAGQAERPPYNSRKIYLAGSRHPNVRVPFREISLAPTKTISGQIEVNEPVRVYDTSGPWGDETVALDVEQGLPALRAEWVRARGDVEEIDGRAVKPIDDGYLSETHRNGNSKSQNPNPNPATAGPNPKFQRKPLRARNGHAVTQLAYARAGIITPEMEFIAIRENMRAVAGIGDPGRGNGSHPTGITDPGYNRNDLAHQHPGN
jgi:hypothetical protein